jgi:hypothetical protein
MRSDNQFTALGASDLPTKFGFFTDANNTTFGVNELLASIIIMAASSVLFLYWFRYIIPASSFCNRRAWRTP